MNFEASSYRLLRLSWHTARKEHQCSWCERTIQPGDRYRVIVSTGYEGLCMTKMCAPGEPQEARLDLETRRSTYVGRECMRCGRKWS